MSLKYEPELDHVGFDWSRDAATIEAYLLGRRVQILTKVGFYLEYGTPEEPGYIGDLASIHLIREIAGILARAAAIVVDGGFKAPHRLIATLRAVEKDPSLVRSKRVEPEALGSLASSYQRADEPRGTFWFDVTEPSTPVRPTADRIRAAAKEAIRRLKAEAKRGRPKKLMLDHLAFELRGIFLRFNPGAKRRSVHSADRNGRPRQVEAGPFIEFLKEVTAPLNNYLRSLPNSHGERGPLSPAYIARIAISSDLEEYGRRFGGSNA
ncbi:hypothetical protein [Bradyrhizobium valentinum]|uniref:hypothetical protein n=1 Tax=Bradyrhizobium valentinum TaxID=1518501 RepID=UPI00070E9C83|nr:hypothetical protein [Bradyrhizobium valentinum]KRR14252.1 hypothetical protein CQ10_00595 [Bradyrhizobium valentinum]